MTDKEGIAALQNELDNLGWDYAGVEYDLQSLVNNIRKATDLKKLQELTEMNYPEES